MSIVAIEDTICGRKVIIGDDLVFIVRKCRNAYFYQEYHILSLFLAL